MKNLYVYQENSFNGNCALINGWKLLKSTRESPILWQPSPSTHQIRLLRELFRSKASCRIEVLLQEFVFATGQ